MILQGDALRLPLRSGSVHCAICSPPYWGLRRYAAEGHLGLEKSPTTYVYKLIRVFREVRRVLRDDGVLWVNLAGCYSSGDRATYRSGASQNKGHDVQNDMPRPATPSGYKPGDYIDLPGMVVRALQQDGWWWRATIIFEKKNPMPESVQGVRWERHRVKTAKGAVGRRGTTEILHRNNHLAEAGLADWADCPGCPMCSPNDGLILRRGSWRPTTSHEFVFMLTKSQRYWADGEAVKEVYSSAAEHATRSVLYEAHGDGETSKGRGDGHNMLGSPQAGRNLRSVLSLATQPYAWAMCKGCQEIYSPERFRRLHQDNGRRVCACGAKEWLSHYATFPEALVEPLIKASTSERGCCQTCGAGWARVVERTGHQNQREPAHAPRHAPTKTDSTGWAPMHRTTEAWRPTCACGGPVEMQHGDLEMIGSPTGSRIGEDPSLETGRAGMNRPRGPNEGADGMTRYEQRAYAEQLRRSPHRPKMEAEAGPAFAHYVRTDRSGARPAPRRLLEVWIGREWLSRVELPAVTPLPPVPAVVLDPFSGAGTVAFIAGKLGRKGVGVDLSWEYSRMAVARIAKGESWDPPAVPEAQMRLGV